MKTILWLISFVLIAIFSFTARSQSFNIGLELGIQAHQLKFENSNSEILDYHGGTSVINGISGLYSLNNILNLNFGISHYNVNGWYNDNQVSSLLNLNYLRPRLNVEFDLSKADSKISPFAGLGCGLGILTNGIQTINSSIYNLKESNALGNDIHLIGQLGISLSPSDIIKCRISYSIQNSLVNNENQETQQVSRLFMHGISTGIYIHL